MKQIKRMLSIFTDKVFLRFLLVGIVNTLFGSTIMFTFYNVFHFGYWFSSASNYFFGSILSFFLNKNFTFQNKEKSLDVAFRFTVNIAACYLIAYGMARPLIRYFLTGVSQSIADNASMFLGMGLFVMMNYLSQRFLTFRSK
ncbi:MAG: GtrA family protein [Clostridia bacterium]|nr:GtrA family protein [Clostridia bacterium]